MSLRMLFFLCLLHRFYVPCVRFLIHDNNTNGLSQRLVDLNGANFSENFGSINQSLYLFRKIHESVNK